MVLHMTSIKRSLVAGVLAAPLVLAACGGGSGNGSGTNGTTGADFVVNAKEYNFDQPQYTTKPGTVKIAYDNKGQLSHSLVIEGIGGFKILVAPGHSKTASVSLPAGTYTLYCDVSGHRSLGMHASLLVQA
jgi:plastocyanin